MSFEEIKRWLDLLEKEYYVNCPLEDNCPFDDDVECEKCPENIIHIKLCNFREVKHNYRTWTGTDDDYGDFWNDHSESVYNALIKNERVYFLTCDECCGCGDW